MTRKIATTMWLNLELNTNLVGVRVQVPNFSIATVIAIFQRPTFFYTPNLYKWKIVKSDQLRRKMSFNSR